MVTLRIEKYQDKLETAWDNFILSKAYNGTFLQTRNFLNYHPKDRFEDYSLIIYKGVSDILAVIPGCIQKKDEKKAFVSHPGSTFGGILVHRQFYNLEHIEAVFEIVEKYLKEDEFQQIIIKQPSQIFSKRSNDLIEYFFFQRQWKRYSELSFVIDLSEYLEDVTVYFSARRRRDYKYSEKNGLRFRKLEDNEIGSFYKLLCENLEKFGAVPVHTLKELEELKKHRLKEIVEFYGSFTEEKLVAASMVFYFEKDVFHTQYLAADQQSLKLYSNNHLDTHLIRTAKEMGFHFFSFGISTEEHGSKLNRQLAGFKEGFGTSYSNNKTWWKEL